MAKVTLDLPEEWIEILASEYGYTDKITEPTVVNNDLGQKVVQTKEVKNPLSKEDFIVQVVCQRLLDQVRSHKLNQIARETSEKKIH